MKRFDLSKHSRPHLHWPENPSDDLQLFSGRRPLRKLVVLADADAVDRSEVPGDPADERKHVAALLSLPLIVRFYYSDEGPPADITPTIHAGGANLYPDWVVLDPRTEERNRVAIYSDREGSYTMSAVWGNATSIAQSDMSTDVYGKMSPDQAAQKRHDDVLASKVASEGIGADIFVTERPFLHKRGGYSTRGVAVCTPLEAIGLIGLYLRAQGDFSITKGLNFNRGLFYWVGARELLPAAWRWFGACVQHSAASNDDSLMLLSGSLLQRVHRALERRDHVHISLNQPQNNDLRDEALSGLDEILIYLMAAIDVAARVAHRVLGMSGDEYAAAWQKTWPRGWLSRIQSVQPDLANVVSAGSIGDDVLTIVRLLRNSVHGAALQGVAFVEGSAAQQTFVGLPAKDETTLLAAMDRLGGRDFWGARSILPGRTHLDPGAVVEKLFEHVPALLNELMVKTPVEHLPHVNLSSADALPPAGSLSNPFEPWKRKCVRRLLGL